MDEEGIDDIWFWGLLVIAIVVETSILVHIFC